MELLLAFKIILLITSATRPLTYLKINFHKCQLHIILFIYFFVFRSFLNNQTRVSHTKTPYPKYNKFRINYKYKKIEINVKIKVCLPNAYFPLPFISVLDEDHLDENIQTLRLPNLLPRMLNSYHNKLYLNVRKIDCFRQFVFELKVS